MAERLTEEQLHVFEDAYGHLSDGASHAVCVLLEEVRALRAELAAVRKEWNFDRALLSECHRRLRAAQEGWDRDKWAELEAAQEDAVPAARYRALESPAVVEALAEAAHVAWSGWIEYMFGKSNLDPLGHLIVPAWAVERWSRQARTAYSRLPENEQESDRIEARRYIRALADALREEVPDAQ